MSKVSRARGLGRGLDALLPAGPLPTSQKKSPTLFVCPIEQLVPNRGQPRRDFDEEAMQQLADSIKLHGLLEPLVVRRVAPAEGDASPSGSSQSAAGREERFEIVAGERRWRACQRAGVHEVPVHLRQVEDQSAFELALVENVQREDLNPIEFASALQKLMSDYGHTQEALATLLHRDRSTLANALRLLKLPEAVRQMIVAGRLSEGHGRALLAAPDAAAQIRLAEKAADNKWSVRQTEASARALKEADGSPVPATGSGRKSPGIRDLEVRLARRYGTRCEVRDRKGKGEIRIRYASLDELDRILEQMFP